MNEIWLLAGIICCVTSLGMTKRENVMKRGCLRPKVLGWSVKDFKLNVTWTQRSCSRSNNVTYKIQISLQGHRNSVWQNKTCDIVRKRSHFHCSPEFTKTRASDTKFYYRVCAFYPVKMSRFNSSKFCKRFPRPMEEIEMSRTTTFSKPQITIAQEGTTWLKANIKPPTDEILCTYKTLVFSAKILKVNESWNQSVCTDHPPPDNQPFVAKNITTIEDKDKQNPCLPELNHLIWTIKDLTPDTEYCITAYVDTDRTKNPNGPSDTGFFRIRTSPDNSTLIPVIVPIGILLLGLCSAIICLFIFRVRKFQKSLRELPPNLKCIVRPEAWRITENLFVADEEELEIADSLTILIDKQRESQRSNKEELSDSQSTESVTLTSPSSSGGSSNSSSDNGSNSCCDGRDMLLSNNDYLAEVTVVAQPTSDPISIKQNGYWKKPSPNLNR